MCVCPVLGIPSSETPPFPIPDVPVSVYGTRLVAWVSFWALYYLLVPISSLYPPGLYSRLHCYWSPSGILPTSQLVSKCLCSFYCSLFCTLLSYSSLCCSLFSKPLLAAHCLLIVKLFSLTYKALFPSTAMIQRKQHTWFPNVPFHLFAFLLIVLSFWMVTLHFCPVNFYSSFKMHPRGHFLCEIFWSFQPGIISSSLKPL